MHFSPIYISSVNKEGGFSPTWRGGGQQQGGSPLSRHLNEKGKKKILMQVCGATATSTHLED